MTTSEAEKGQGYRRERTESSAKQGALQFGIHFCWRAEEKRGERRVVVIEVNDNPSIDAGVEDLVLKDDLYLTIIRSVIRRINGSKN